MKEPLQDFEKALLLLAVQHGHAATGGIIVLLQRLLDWDEQRARMAMARCEEFGFVDRTT